MAIVTGVIVIVFGTLTLVLHDESLHQGEADHHLRPVRGDPRRRPAVRPFLHRRHVRPDVQPDASGLADPDAALGAVFFGLAILNEIVWRTQSTDFWVNFKVFGVTPLTMIFAIAQMPLTKRYHLEPATLPGGERGGWRRCAQVSAAPTLLRPLADEVKRRLLPHADHPHHGCFCVGRDACRVDAVGQQEGAYGI